MSGNTPVIGATAMVFGFNILQNLTQLAPHVRHAEILLYWTSTENNFPNKHTIAELTAAAQGLGLSLSVHLPPMLDLITANAAEREHNLELLIDLIQMTELLNPKAYVLHLGPNKPTLNANPAAYLYAETTAKLNYWYANGFAALQNIQAQTGLGGRLLLENLDFSPLLLKPFLAQGLATLCLDIGHMWLGAEEPETVFDELMPFMEEMHLHGVCDGNEHLSLNRVNNAHFDAFIDLVKHYNYAKTINLEVFTPDDFSESLLRLKTGLKLI